MSARSTAATTRTAVMMIGTNNPHSVPATLNAATSTSTPVGGDGCNNTSPTAPVPGPPRGFFCPLTYNIMYDPVLDTEGNTYERSAIVTWLTDYGHTTSPISRQPLSIQLLLPNISLRDTIHEYMGKKWVREYELKHGLITDESDSDNKDDNTTELSSDKGGMSNNNKNKRPYSNGQEEEEAEHVGIMLDNNTTGRATQPSSSLLLATVTGYFNRNHTTTTTTTVTNHMQESSSNNNNNNNNANRCSSSNSISEPAWKRVRRSGPSSCTSSSFDNNTATATGTANNTNSQHLYHSRTTTQHQNHWESHNHHHPVVPPPTTAAAVTVRPCRLREKINSFLCHISKEFFPNNNNNNHHPTNTNNRTPTTFSSSSSSNHNHDFLLHLNASGCCAFKYDHTTIVIDVPEHIGIVCFYTKNLIPPTFLSSLLAMDTNCGTAAGLLPGGSSPATFTFSPAQKQAMCMKALQLNCYQAATRGGVLSLRTLNCNDDQSDYNEFMFSYTARVVDVNVTEFTSILLNFIELCMDLRNQIVFAALTTV